MKTLGDFGGWQNFDTGEVDWSSRIPTDLRPYVRPDARKVYDLLIKTGKSQTEAFIEVGPKIQTSAEGEGDDLMPLWEKANRERGET